MHRIHHPDLHGEPGAVLIIAGEEAHHAARVKRAGPGDAVELLDGRGTIARASITAVSKDRRTGEWVLELRTTGVRRAPRPAPRLNVWTSPPKGARLESMIDELSQAGAAAWTPLHAARTVVDPREGKLARLHRLAVEASKQCGRAWDLEILPGGSFRDSLAGPAVVVADGSGAAYRASGAEEVRLLIGPEGGWAPEELAAARAGGAQVAAFGPHVMRIETAAVVASGIVLDQELRFRGGGRNP